MFFSILNHSASDPWRCDGAVIPGECIGNLLNAWNTDVAAKKGIEEPKAGSDACFASATTVAMEGDGDESNGGAVSVKQIDLHLEKTLSMLDNDNENDKGATRGKPSTESISPQENLTPSNVKETNSYAKNLLRRHDKCNKAAQVSRFRCENNCNFDLCFDCFDFLKREGEDGLSEEEERLRQAAR